LAFDITRCASASGGVGQTRQIGGDALDLVSYATSASTTVVSVRTLCIRTSLASAACASSASLSCCTACGPQRVRVVIFINVVGCGTGRPSGIRQNRRQVNESATSAHSGSYPNR
jgi:hypothetical protein